MTHEIAGLLAMTVIILASLWIISFAWAAADVARQKHSKKWIAVSIAPIVGAAAYYFRHGDGKFSAKLKRLFLNRWTVVAIIIIMLLSMYVRLIDYRWPYLRNIDSYVFYRWMDETVANNGILPTLDVYAKSPEGFFRPPEWIYPYFYTGAYSYMAVNSLVQMQLWEFLIYFPPFLATLAIVPIYFIGKMLYDRKAGVIAAFIYVFDVSNMLRSLGGDPDSDAIVILVSSIVMAALIFTYKYANEVKRFDKKLLVYSVLTAAVLWVWYSTWAGYWYITWLFAGFVFLKLIFTIMRRKSAKLGWQETKFIIISFVIYTALSFALTVPSYGETKITSALAGPIQFQSIKGEEAQFPNVYVSVAELQQQGGPREIIERTTAVGGPAILISSFFFMIYTIIYLFYAMSNHKHKFDRFTAVFLWFIVPFLIMLIAYLVGNLLASASLMLVFVIYLALLTWYTHESFKRAGHIDTAILLLVWFFGPFLATLVAVRFSTLFSAPLAIGSAILLSKLIRMATGEDKNWSD